jgi:hypothetical protein
LPLVYQVSPLNIRGAGETPLWGKKVAFLLAGKYVLSPTCSRLKKNCVHTVDLSLDWKRLR